MKKISAFLMGVSLAASMALAENTATSVNAVGFVKKSIPPGGKLALVAINFDLVGTTATNGGISIQDLLPGQLTGGTTASSGDNIIIWDGVNQKYNTLFLVAAPGNPKDGKWIYNSDKNIATNLICNGQGFWIRNNHSFTQDVVFAGQVVDRASKTNSMMLGEGLSIFGYPFSCSSNINSNDLYKAATGGTTASSGDNLMVWDIDNQKYVTLFLVAAPGNPKDGKWIYNSDKTIATNSFELGTGVWFRRQNAGSVQWNEPQKYSLR